MSVYTTLEDGMLEQFLQRLDVGELVDCQGISAGIENSNFFVTTEKGEFVLTLFEQISAEEVPFYLGLNRRLAEYGLPTATALVTTEGEAVFELSARPAILVPRLAGTSPLEPTSGQCFNLGVALATLHKVTVNGLCPRENPRGQEWLLKTAGEILPHLPPAEAAMLTEELSVQRCDPFKVLPRGVIHADLFRDNTLFEEDKLTGMLDFYCASEGAFILDLAITVNDWCSHDSGEFNRMKLEALLAGYESVRILQESEKGLWNLALRAAALRFWVSRLFEAIFPKEGVSVLKKDPTEFRAMLALRIREPVL